MARKQKPPMQKSMTVAELRVLLAKKEAQLQTCIGYNRQWQEVATGLERQKTELLRIVERQRDEIEHWKKLAIGQVH